MLKNKIILAILAIMLAVPVLAEEESYNPALEPVENQEIVQQASELPSVKEELPEVSKIQYKQPVSKKKMVKKFLMAMGGVAISSLLLYILLTIYNKIRNLLSFGKEDLQELDETSLETPDSASSAIRTFLEKTKWGQN